MPTAVWDRREYIYTGEEAAEIILPAIFATFFNASPHHPRGHRYTANSPAGQYYPTLTLYK